MTKTKTKTNRSVDPNLETISGYYREDKINTNNDPKTWMDEDDEFFIKIYQIFEKYYFKRLNHKQSLIDYDKKQKKDGGPRVPDWIIECCGKWEKDNLGKLVYIFFDLLDPLSKTGPDIIDSYEQDLSEIDISFDDLIEKQKPFLEVYNKHGLIKGVI
tara:strand:+ start:5086 stop:5559 length:474 start_codon:yes stop_codon:yes gene_type:complete